MSIKDKFIHQCLELLQRDDVKDELKNVLLSFRSQAGIKFEDNLLEPLVAPSDNYEPQSAKSKGTIPADWNFA